jgi:acyl-[acyl-carrier-protein]-phospholipid O-acyltransferase/long-chain-fatty-acid--[acyl-carrier-protein] ligase
LNYTSSPEIVSACLAMAEISRVVPSRACLDKLGWKPSGELILLEDAKPSALDLARGALVLIPGLHRLLFPRAAASLDSVATVLFTSGSTGIPKGVELTHANILSNFEAVAQVYQVGSDDRILGVLPFFHAMGLTVTFWMPLAAGVGAVYHYNPLDAKRVGELAGEHAATLLIGTPTFLLAYVRRVEAAQFKSLRVVVAGAEKLREEVAKAFEEKFGVTPMEGYGATELSPVAAVNIPDVRWPGVSQKGSKPGSVGQPVPGVLMKVVDPESGRELPPGESGLLLVKGPNVMKGYLGESELTREVLRDGFYVSGDIAAIDEDGFVTITDRLSRFSKIAGEMVPHIRVEETLQALAGAVEQTFVVTAVPDAKRGEKLVVLHTDYPDLEGLLRKLRASDLPKLWVPSLDAFHKVEKFPLLGSGKLDLAALKAAARRLEGL